MKCGGKAVEVQGSLSELKISSMELKRLHICRSEGRGGFCQMQRRRLGIAILHFLLTLVIHRGILIIGMIWGQDYECRSGRRTTKKSPTCMLFM